MAVLGVRQVDLVDRPPSSSIRASVASNTSRHARLDALAGELRRHAEAQAVQPLGGGQLDRLGQPDEVESHASAPTMWRSSRAASVTSRVSGPAWSSDEAKAIMP